MKVEWEKNDISILAVIVVILVSGLIASGLYSTLKASKQRAQDQYKVWVKVTGNEYNLTYEQWIASGCPLAFQNKGE